MIMISCKLDRKSTPLFYVVMRFRFLGDCGETGEGSWRKNGMKVGLRFLGEPGKRSTALPYLGLKGTRKRICEFGGICYVTMNQKLRNTEMGN